MPRQDEVMAASNPVPAMRMRPRPKYLALTLTAVNRAMAYRGTTLLNLVSNLIWVVVLYYLWRTVFAGRSRIEGFDWDEMRTYILVAYAVNSLIAFGSVARITNTIRSGEVATDLTRPVDYLGTQLAQAFGAALIEGAFGGGIALLLGALVLDIAPPNSLFASALFLISVWLGFLIKFLVSYLVALLCFRTMNAIGLIWAQTAVTNLLSGALIPLAFFPGWVRSVVLALPFQGIVYTPVSIYLGKVQGIAMLQALGIQVLWAAILWGLARLLWAPSVRGLEIQGG